MPSTQSLSVATGESCLLLGVTMVVVSPTLDGYLGEEGSASIQGGYSGCKEAAWRAMDQILSVASVEAGRSAREQKVLLLLWCWTAVSFGQSEGILSFPYTMSKSLAMSCFLCERSAWGVFVALSTVTKCVLGSLSDPSDSSRSKSSRSLCRSPTL